MKKSVTVGVVDYGMGNLHSVAKAFSLQGANVTVSDSRSRLSSSDLLVLPGVGSFGAAMKNLGRKKMDDFVRHWIDDQKPYMGICLGLQLLFDKSEEDSGVSGLSVLPGRVVKFRRKDFRSGNYCVPHMGWNTLDCENESMPLLNKIDGKASFYFVHTYYADPADKECVFTKTQYGKNFCSSVRKGALFATQFHPEKSGRVGLRLLSNVIQGVKS